MRSIGGGSGGIHVSLVDPHKAPKDPSGTALASQA